ncbi:MAG TPA: arylamine N-acetyltransferase [Acidobacteriota bacterium]|nr:arylamine N-acetyltransferase [Acidobacteriota bacterium]
MINQSAVDLAQLTSIAKAFAHLPYENVTKILKDAKSTTVREKLRKEEEVIADHLRWNTGGTCFSLCNALNAVLKNSGFDPFIAMGDMHYGRNIHCAVIIPLNGGRYLIDPGYLLHHPMLLPESAYETRLKTHMNTVVVRSEDDITFSLYTIESSQLKWRYRLHAVPISDEEFVRHWIHSFSLNSMEHVTLSRMNEKGRLYFRKGRLDQVNESQRIRSEFHDSAAHELSEIFGLPADLISNARDVLLARPRLIGKI